jgi:hypothetical protein
MVYDPLCWLIECSLKNQMINLMAGGAEQIAALRGVDVS